MDFNIEHCFVVASLRAKFYLLLTSWKFCICKIACDFFQTTQPKTLQTCCKLYIFPVCFNLSTNCNELVNFIKLQQIRLVAICHLQTCYNLLKQLAASRWITSFDNQFATSLLTTFNNFAVNKLSQAMRTHPDIGLL